MDEERKNNSSPNIENVNQNNSEEQNKENKTQQDDKLNAQDMEQVAKSGASLAKNAATGNVVGAAKDALNLAKNKKIRNKIIRRTIIQFASPILLIIFLAAAFLGVLGAVADTVGDVLGNIGQAIVDFFTVDSTDGAITVTDEQIDTIINSIEEQGISTEDLKLLGDYDENASEAEKQRAVRKYIRKFYEAQAVTETLNYYHYDSTNDKTYGAIYVYRANGDVNEDISNRQELTYISYDKMQEMIADNKKEATEHFSIDDSDNLILASANETIVKTGSDINYLTEDKDQSSYKIVQKSINYKSLVSQYTTKMNFLIDLTLISQNPEFVSAVVDLIKDSRIEITIMDNTTTNVKTVTHTYKRYVRMSSDIGPTPGTSGSPYGFSNLDKTKDQLPLNTDITQTTTIERTPSIQINYVKTWFCEQRKNYTKNTDGPNEVSNVTTHPADETVTTGDGNWKVDQTITTVETNTTERYQEIGSGEGVQITLGEQGDGERYENGEIDEPTFVGLMETEYRIPYSTREEAAGTNLISGAEMLFYLLQKDPDLENMEIIMRYALNIYTGSEKYGKNLLDDILSRLEIQMKSTGYGDYTVDTRKSDSEIVITDADVLKSALEATYSGQTRENLVNEVDSFLEMQYTYSVNAVFAVAVTIIESSGGTNWAAIAPETHNWMSLTGSYNGQTYRNPNSSNTRTWRVYPSFREATLDFGDLIANSSYYFKNGKYTVNTIAPTYCDAAWGTKVNSEMTKIFNAAGIDVSSIMINQGGITTQEEADALEQTIENEWLHTKIHSNNYTYQNGPFAKWWSYSYNLLDPFQCTWWANGRASMYLEQYGTKYKKYPTQYGHGGMYYSVNRDNGWFAYGSEPRANSIVSWSYGGYGHVAYVEGVTSDGIYISHAGNGASWFGVQKIPLDGSVWDYGPPDGYIYLDSPL